MNIHSIFEKFGRIYRTKAVAAFARNVLMGNGVIIDFKTRIINSGNKVSLGNNVILRSGSRNYHAGMPFGTTLLIDIAGAAISIGDNTRINGAYIHAQKGIAIGANCVIASGVNILDSNGHELISVNRTIGRDKAEEIIIEDNVWLGLNAIILKGTTIGKNSVVGAGSVVKGHFPPNSLIAGNPAIAVKTLNIA